MGLIAWIGRQLGLGGRPTVAQLRAERDWLVEQIKAYTIGYNRLSPLAENLTGETQEIRDQYRQMLKEPVIKAAFLKKVFSVASLDLTVKAATKDQAAQDLAEFHKDNLTKSKGGVRAIVLELLLHALMDGFVVAEKVRDVARRGKWKGKIVLKQLKAKDTAGSKIQLVLDQYKNVIAIRANNANAGREFDPKDFVVLTYLSFFGSPFGMSDFRAVFRASSLKEAAIRLRMIFLDKFTGPYLKGKFTDDATRTYLEAALKKARASGYITLPEGSDVEVIDLALRGTADFKQAIDDFDREILVGMQGSFLDMMEGQTPGGRGDTAVHKSTAELFVWYMAELVKDCINDQLVPEFTDLNFAGDPELPLAELGGVDPASILADLQIDKLLHELGASLSLEDLYDRAQRPMPKSPDDTLPGAKPPAAGPGFQFADDQPTADATAGGSRAGTPFVEAAG